jgi:acyl-CoA thioester hydrolase
VIAIADTIAVRVYYEDTDAAGIVYHANYLKYAERGRSDMLRSLGIGPRQLREETGVDFAVRRCTIEYLAAARLDDMLSVETRLEKFGVASLDIAHTIARDGEPLARLAILVACIGTDGRARRLPARLRAALAQVSQDPPTIVQKTP